METLRPRMQRLQINHPEAIQRQHALILLWIVSIAAAIRFFHLNSQSVWFDEAFSIAHSVRPLNELLRELIQDAGHPPLHYFLLHGWFQLAGFGAMQARLFVAIFGVAAIPLLFVLARRFADPATSLVAAFLLAISQMGVYFSQEARPYTQVQFLSLLAALAFLSFLQIPSFWRAMSFGAVATALLYTHYYGVGTLLALGLYWLIFRRDYSPFIFRRLAAIVVLIILAYVPWIILLQSAGSLDRNHLTITKGAAATQRPTLSSPLAALNRFNNGKFESIESASAPAAFLLGLAIFTLPAVGALWRTWRSAPQGVVLGWLLASIPVVLAIAFGAFGSIFNYRHYAFAIPGYYLAVAIGWRICFRSMALRAVWLVIAATFSVLALRANLVVTKPDYREGFRPLAQSFEPGDCVSGGPSMWHERVHLAWEVYYRDRGRLQLVPFNSLTTAYTECERLWLVWDRTWWMDFDRVGIRDFRNAIGRLTDRYAIVGRYEHPAIDLYLLKRKPAGD